eukprot:COSAG01_NODE_10807_length_2075_cov_80.497976_2_plen_74_part_00
MPRAILRYYTSTVLSIDLVHHLYSTPLPVLRYGRDVQLYRGTSTVLYRTGIGIGTGTRSSTGTGTGTVRLPVL